MAVTVREQVLAAFFAKLEAITGVYGLSVERNRDTEVTGFPTVVQADGPVRADRLFSSTTTYTAQVDVEAYVQADATGKTREEQLDELYGKVVQAVTADPTLGGLAVDVQEIELATRPDRTPGHMTGGALLASFEIMFETVEGDPFTQA